MSLKDHPFLVGLKAARANLVPALILQAAILALVLGYYWHEPTRLVLEKLAAVKAAHGYLFSMVASIIGGALLPEFFNIVVFQHCRIRPVNWANLRFTVPYWGLDGMFVDALYRFQGVMFGNDPTWRALVGKVMVDQFFVTPVILIPIGLACYEWKHQNYVFTGLGRTFTWAFYKERGIPTLVTNWAMWIPLLFGVYAFPPTLQVPVFALALAIWVMLFNFINAVGRNKLTTK